MGVHIKCALCAASASLAGGESPQNAGWLQITVSGRRGTRYLCICPQHKDSDVTAALKATIAEKR